MPKANESAVFDFSLNIRSEIIHTAPHSKKPVINPPVGESRYPTPAPKCEKTGRPAAPRKIYRAMEAVPFLLPRSDRAR